MVSSFAMQLKYDRGLQQDLSKTERLNEMNFNGEFEDLGCIFKELGFIMMEIGIRLARVCDRIIGGCNLEESLLESCTAKGRLIHYHSYVDNVISKEISQRKKSFRKKKIANRRRSDNERRADESKLCNDQSKFANGRRLDERKLCDDQSTITNDRRLDDSKLCNDLYKIGNGRRSDESKLCSHQSKIANGRQSDESKLCDDQSKFANRRRLDERKLCNDSNISSNRRLDESKLCNELSEIANGRRSGESKLCDDQSNLWQQWHYDYGIFTVLTAPMFMLADCSEIKCGEDKDCCIPCAKECSSPSGHTYLQISDPEKDCVLTVKASPESFIVQVGEAADVLSKGKLRATLHCVSRPAEMENLSRETFVVFLQPTWDKAFSLADYPLQRLQSSSTSTAGEVTDKEQESANSPQEIYKIIPPLCSRLKDGMTFAEFSKVTTKQYYGGSGLQSKR